MTCRILCAGDATALRDSRRWFSDSAAGFRRRLVNDGVQTLYGPPDIIPNRTQVRMLGRQRQHGPHQPTALVVLRQTSAAENI